MENEYELVKMALTEHRKLRRLLEEMVARHSDGISGTHPIEEWEDEFWK